jgi:hypothetical protein
MSMLLGLGLGLGNVQRSMADYFAQREQKKLRDRELLNTQITGMQQLLGPDAFNSPEFLALNEQRGTPIPTRPVTDAASTPFADMQDATAFASQQNEGLAPMTGAVLPQHVRQKQLTDKLTLEQAQNQSKLLKEIYGQLVPQTDHPQLSFNMMGQGAEGAPLGAPEPQTAQAGSIGGIPTHILTQGLVADALGLPAGSVISQSNKAEQRPVLASDANRIAELRNSLDDLKALRDTIAAPGEMAGTGMMAQIGAAVPNFVTEFTGFGTDAKKKQAMIARVKQVIGKALEGGVLRKEDEVKYSHILPTIGDVDDVVIDKLNGLEASIQREIENRLEALTEAGYSTSNLKAGNARRPTMQAKPQSSLGGKTVPQAAVMAWAQRKGITPEQAAQEITARGYTIGS